MRGKMTIHILNGNLLDTEAMELVGERHVTLAEGRIIDVFESGQQSIEIARSAGVELGFGTDLLGEAQPWQNREFAIRAEFEPARDVPHESPTLPSRGRDRSDRPGCIG